MRKTPLNRGKKGLSPVSKSKHRIAKRFVPKEVLKEVKERSGGQCEVWHVLTLWGHILLRYNKTHEAIVIGTKFESPVILQRCEGRAMSQPHHILKRSRAPQDMKHTARNLLDCCFSDHTHVENNDKEAVKYGLSLPYAHYTP